MRGRRPEAPKVRANFCLKSELALGLSNLSYVTGDSMTALVEAAIESLLRRRARHVKGGTPEGQSLLDTWGAIDDE